MQRNSFKLFFLIATLLISTTFQQVYKNKTCNDLIQKQKDIKATCDAIKDKDKQKICTDQLIKVQSAFQDLCKNAEKLPEKAKAKSQPKAAAKSGGKPQPAKKPVKITPIPPKTRLIDLDQPVDSRPIWIEQQDGTYKVKMPNKAIIDMPRLLGTFDNYVANINIPESMI